LTSLLAQPLSRSRLLLSKVVVLAALLVLLSLIAALVLLRADGIVHMLGGDSAASQWRLAIVVLTPLLGLCVAPWLTLVFRNATAGWCSRWQCHRHCGLQVRSRARPAWTSTSSTSRSATHSVTDPR
jgi:hypothetical protein